MESDPRARFIDQLKQLRTQADLEAQDPDWPVSDLLGALPRDSTNEIFGDAHAPVVQAGFIQGGVHFHGADPEPAQSTERRRFGAVPPRAGAFQRRPVAETLVDAAAGGGTTVLTGTRAASVLTGLGGVGKTQLAADHAHTQWDHGRVQLLVWISARSRDAVTSAYAEVAVELLGQDSAKPQRAWRRLLEWLAETTTSWLVVLDDLQDPDHLTGLWPPHTSNGQVVVTTRRRDAALYGHQRQIVDIGLFTSEEALAYLAEKLPDRACTAPAELAGLADDLGHLPLALAQAAAYLTNKSLLTTADYRTRLADQRTRLPEVLPRQTHLPDEHERTVAATWSLSIEAADELDPAGLARPALELASLLDPAGIPAAVFTTNAVTHRLTARLGRDITGEDVLGGLECLRRFSLITLRSDQPHHAVRVHALVQRAVRDALVSDALADLARTAADALVLVWPGIETNQELVQALRSNTNTLHGTAEAHLWQPEGHSALFRLVRSFRDAGLLESAIALNQRLFQQASARLGPDHRDTLTTRHNLARLRGEAGNPSAAVAILTELLPDQLRVLGPDHPYTLATRANLARWRGEAGEPAAAAAGFAELLPDRARALGPDDPDTLTTRHSVAYWLGEAGNPAAAATALAELLPDQLRVLGPDHPSTLATRANLARWRGEAGDPAAAATVFADLLADRVRVLGPDHPYTLNTRHCLAYWLGEAGNPAAAATALAELLPDQLRVLGPDHPHTLATRGNLARLRGEAGDPAAAATALAELLADQLRVLGPDHRYTLRTRYRLARAYQAAGELDRAVPLYEATLADRERVLGTDHPDTLRSRNNLALAYQAVGDLDRAVPLYEMALADAERVLGPDHPLSRKIRSNISTINGQK